jgi:hypothetical protein
MRGLVAFGFHLMGKTVFWLKSWLYIVGGSHHNLNDRYDISISKLTESTTRTLLLKTRGELERHRQHL